MANFAQVCWWFRPNLFVNWFASSARQARRATSQYNFFIKNSWYIIFFAPAINTKHWCHKLSNFEDVKLTCKYSICFYMADQQQYYLTWLNCSYQSWFKATGLNFSMEKLQPRREMDCKAAIKADVSPLFSQSALILGTSSGSRSICSSTTIRASEPAALWSGPSSLRCQIRNSNSSANAWASASGASSRDTFCCCDRPPNGIEREPSWLTKARQTK